MERFYSPNHEKERPNMERFEGFFHIWKLRKRCIFYTNPPIQNPKKVLLYGCNYNPRSFVAFFRLQSTSEFFES